MVGLVPLALWMIGMIRMKNVMEDEDGGNGIRNSQLN
jgi:hypothetical protein